MTITLAVRPLTAQAFAAYGDVIECAGAQQIPINQGTTVRCNDLAQVDVAEGGGTALISIFRGQPRPQPIRLEVMERHPLGSQAFYPLQDRAWLVVVSDAANPVDPAGLRAFRASGTQGVNYARNIWHHPLLALEPDSDFLVVDRGGPGDNLEEAWFSNGEVYVA
jgi:ureidoglycolate lyase